MYLQSVSVLKHKYSELYQRFLLRHQILRRANNNK